MNQEKISQQLVELLKDCHKYLRNVNEKLITDAFNLCVEAHKEQRRESGELYFTHPISVARILVKEIPLDDISVAAALLHDVVEDTEYDIEYIKQEFGEVVANIVDGVTKISGVFESREITQAASYRKLLLSMVTDVRVILVKFADRLHNMRTLGSLSEERQKRMAQETLDIYAPFAHRFGLGNIKWELEDLSFKYLNRAAYDEIKQALNTKREERADYIEEFASPIEERLQELGKFKFEISGRPKHLYSIYNKMVSQGKGIDEIYDLFAVRIILDTPDVNDCFVVYGIVADIYTPDPTRFKNYISVPKKNGYQSLHTTVFGPSGRKVEVQIRTRTMHEVSEKGVAAHFRYKEDGVNSYIEDKELEEWAKWVREIFDKSGDGTPEQLIESFKLNLYQDEIYLFTPKGDLKILPKNATPVDFAFEIHSRVGYSCIGAKVGGKIVPLDYKLRSGDQVEILTSKNQTPNKNWEKFLVTHKAKLAIRKYLNEEKRREQQEGKEIWEKKVKKMKFHINDDDFEKVLHSLRYENRGEFYYALGNGGIEIDIAYQIVQDKWNNGLPQRVNGGSMSTSEQINFSNYANHARNQSGISVVGGGTAILYAYAKCCNPVPGDDVIGIVTVGSGIKIHRRNCKNIGALHETAKPRMIEVGWSGAEKGDFIAAIRITGEDRPAMLNDLTSAIVSYNNTNIRSVNIESTDSLFEGVITVYVKNTEHLHRIFDKVKKIKGVKSVERFEE